MRNSTDSEVTNSAIPSQNLMVLTAASEAISMCFKLSVVMIDAGTLPKASNRTIFQSILPSLPCAKIPTLLVTAAYSKSVPTAKAGLM